MRYNKIRKMDISNGPGVRVSVFFQGCHFHCKGCFNSDTWDFDGGKEFNDEVINHIIDLCNNDVISGLSILGGEPLNPKNIDDCQQIANCLKEKRPVVINLENVEEPTAVRIIDFISGTIYAIDGAVNKISRNVWLFAPKNVNIAVSQQNHGLNNMPWEPNNNNK